MPEKKISPASSLDSLDLQLFEGGANPAVILQPYGALNTVEVRVMEPNPNPEASNAYVARKTCAAMSLATGLITIATVPCWVASCISLPSTLCYTLSGASSLAIGGGLTISAYCGLKNYRETTPAVHG